MLTIIEEKINWEVVTSKPPSEVDLYIYKLD